MNMQQAIDYQFPDVSLIFKRHETKIPTNHSAASNEGCDHTTLEAIQEPHNNIIKSR